MAESQRGQLRPKVIKVKLRDSVSVSSGSGNRDRPRSRSGGGSRGGGAGVTATVERTPPPKQRKQDDRSRVLQAERQRLTQTSVVERGGATLQETRGDVGVLKKLNKQRPGSKLVKDEKGQFVLIEARDFNLENKRNFDRLNENLALLDQGLFTEIPRTEQGGFAFSAKLSDGVGVSQGLGGVVELVSESKSRPATAREQAEMITEGKEKPFFIGTPSKEVTRQQEISASQQNITKQVFPQTFVDSRGQEIVTITGKSEGAKFGVFETPRKEKQTQGQSSVLNLLEARQPEKKSKPEDILKGFLAGAQNFANVILQPKPIFGDITKGKIGIKESTATRTSQKVDKIVPPQPSFTGSAIEQISRGEVPSGSGEGIFFDIGSVGFDAATILTPIKKVPIPKIQKPITTKVTTPKAKPTPFRQTVFRDVFDEDTAIFGFSKQKIPLSKAGQSRIIEATQPKPARPVEIDPDFRPNRLPVSKFPSELPEGVLADFKVTKQPLGSAATKTIQTDRIRQSSISLGEGRGIRPGKDFTTSIESLGSGATKTIQTEQRLSPETRISLGLGLGKSLKGELTTRKIALGSAAIKTPPRPFGKIDKPVEIDPDFTPSRLPDDIGDDTALFGFTEQKINIGRGIIKNPSDKTKLSKDFTKPKPPVSRTKPEDEIRVTKGLVSLMQKPQKFTSTKVELGKSSQTLQVKNGRVIQDSIQTPKARPSQSFSEPKTSTRVISIQQETLRFPPSSKRATITSLGIQTRQDQKLGQKITQTSLRPSLRVSTQIKPLQRQKTRSRFAVPTSPRAKPTTIQTPAQKQPPVQKTILIDRPKIPPPVIAAARFSDRPRREPKPRDDRKKPRVDFLGSTNIETVEGFRTKKTDISFGKKTAKLAAKNISKTRKRPKVSIF
jgi:hypothetical protein